MSCLVCLHWQRLDLNDITQAPTIENLVLLADSSFDVEALVNMEHTVLRMLEFKVSVHTTCYFAARLALAARMSEKEHRFMDFLLGKIPFHFVLIIYWPAYNLLVKNRSCVKIFSDDAVTD